MLDERYLKESSRNIDTNEDEMSQLHEKLVKRWNLISANGDFFSINDQVHQ